MAASDTDGARSPFVEPIRATRTYENAIEGILLGIEQAGLREGDPLPNETELSAQLGISKPTLRQALRVLERSGLITVKRGKDGGIFLASDFLPHDDFIDKPAIDDRAAVNVLRARRAVETAVNAEALHAATEKDLDDIDYTIRLLNEPRIGTENILRADSMFHRAVGRAAHNSVLDEALRGVYRHLTGLRHPQLRSSARRVRAIHTEHLAALRARDPAALATALDTHFRFLEDAVAQSLGRPWEELFGDRSPQDSSGQKNN